MPCSLPRRIGPVHVSVASRTAQPSPFLRRVGIRNFTFEACSSFTRVTACKVARPPFQWSLSRGFDRNGYPPQPLASYHVYRQLHGWVMLPLVNCAIWGALRNRGLVVMSSCSHRGVVNAVKRAITVSGVTKVHAVLGGLHLAPHKDDYVRDTVLALKELNPDAVVRMHCTGEPFMEIAAREMPGKVVRSYTGTRYVFAA